jgi:transposase
MEENVMTKKKTLVKDKGCLTDVTVKLVGEDGNAFAILGRVSVALKKAGHKDIAEEYLKEATKGDYNDLLATTMRYVNVE